ncbi:MAG: glycoside hydrolase [Erysipelotrichaceae bacterium]|nr:MAG: glycoside [Erysipelotrichaceae bacterium]TXT18412.1 MAG: glycoside hydrolase [Erysipelotrichaceae bacterium]
MTKWKLVFEDDFSKQTQLDLSHWTIDVGDHGGGNKESQYYTEGMHNLSFEDGALHFEGRKEKYKTREYTSAKIWTKGKLDWMYGRFEICAKVPTGTGTWPAIWTLGTALPGEKWPDMGEIDIMEHVGRDQNEVHFSLHSKLYNHRAKQYATVHTQIPEVSETYKTYVLEWDAEKLSFLVDDQRLATFMKADYPDSWPFNRPHYLILNLALGGGWGGPIDDECLPQRLSIRSVRVYQQD